MPQLSKRVACLLSRGQRGHRRQAAKNKNTACLITPRPQFPTQFANAPYYHPLLPAYVLVRYRVRLSKLGNLKYPPREPPTRSVRNRLRKLENR